MHMIGQGEIRYIVSLAYPFRDTLQLHKICTSRFISFPKMKTYNTLAFPFNIYEIIPLPELKLPCKYFS